MVAVSRDERIDGAEDREEFSPEEGARGEVPNEDFELVPGTISSTSELKQPEAETPHGARRDPEDGLGGREVPT